MATATSEKRRQQRRKPVPEYVAETAKKKRKWPVIHVVLALILAEQGYAHWHERHMQYKFVRISVDQYVGDAVEDPDKYSVNRLSEGVDKYEYLYGEDSFSKEARQTLVKAALNVREPPIP